MSISIKSDKELELMREAGRILALTHEELKKAIKPGITTYDIDKLGEEVIRSYGCVPSFLNYNGYPASICVSVNEEVVHGIPSKNRYIKEGDIVSLDAGVIYKGYHSDAARTYGVGEISAEAEKLIKVTKQSFFEALKVAIPGNHIRDIGRAIEPMITAGDYEVRWLDDDWTVVTLDGSYAAHYENTILITDGEPQILSIADGLEL
jgi:methionyl aminopeptidase